MRGISLSRISRLRTIEVDDWDSSDLYRRYVHHLVSMLSPARIVGILSDVVSIRRMTGLGWGGSLRLLALLLIRSVRKVLRYRSSLSDVRARLLFSIRRYACRILIGLTATTTATTTVGSTTPTCSSGNPRDRRSQGSLLRQRWRLRMTLLLRLLVRARGLVSLEFRQERVGHGGLLGC